MYQIVSLRLYCLLNYPLTSEHKWNLIHLNLVFYFSNCAFLHNTNEQQTSNEVKGGIRNACPRVWRLTSWTELLLRGYNFIVANRNKLLPNFSLHLLLLFFKNLQNLLDELWKQNDVAPVFLCLTAKRCFRFIFWKYFLNADNTNLFLIYFLEFTKLFFDS